MSDLTKVVEEMREMVKEFSDHNGCAPFCNQLPNWATRIEAAQVVDEKMVERAFNAWCDVADVDEWRVRNTNEALRAALTAALAAKESP